MSVTPARKVTLRALRVVRERGAWSHEALSSALAGAGLDDREAAFAMRLTYGVAATQGVLDEAIDRFSSSPSRIEPRVRDILRLAAYELLYERTEPYVAVDQAVSAVGAVLPRARGFVNAVGRRIAESAPGFPWGDPQTDTEAVARLTGTPGWLAEKLCLQLGPARARDVMASHTRPAPVYLAHNPFAGSLVSLVEELTSVGAVATEVGPPGCVRVDSPPAALRSEVVADGRAIVVDAAAQFVAHLAGSLADDGGLIADVAAGRGSKTLLLQAAAHGRARVLAFDLHAFKVEVLGERMRSLRVPGVEACVADASSIESLSRVVEPGTVSVVLVDAPCTGTGTLRRHPEKRWRLAPEDPERMADAASAMLAASASLVRVGGFMVYSTCSVLTEENDAVVTSFLGSEAGSRFQTVPIRDDLPVIWHDSLSDEGWFRSYPAIEGPDGHFAAILRRDE